MDDTTTTKNLTSAEQIAAKGISRWLAFYLASGESCTDLAWLHQVLEEVAHATSNKDRALAYALNLDKRFLN
jgi:hypothetical protein